MKEIKSALSEAGEDYLKAIYELQVSGTSVTTSALAAALAISAPSVSYMLKQLAHKQLVLYRPYHGVTLLPLGEKIAREIVRRHELIETFLICTLGMPKNEAHAEAHYLEHELSERLEEYIARFVQNSLDSHHRPSASKKIKTNRKIRKE